MDWFRYSQSQLTVCQGKVKGQEIKIGRAAGGTMGRGSVVGSLALNANVTAISPLSTLQRKFILYHSRILILVLAQ